jgi:ribonucleoside-diphosphate reductase alpha chain
VSDEEGFDWYVQVSLNDLLRENNVLWGAYENHDYLQEVSLVKISYWFDGEYYEDIPVLDEDTGELREVFLSKGSKGGCLAFTNAVSRLISLLARKGAPLEEIVDQLNSVVVCPSYAAARAAGKEVSPGSSCAASIAKALLEMQKKFQTMFVIGDEEEDHHVQQPMVIDKERITKEVNGPEYAICPECGEKSLMYSGGCNACSNCGWTKCN